MAEEKRIVLAAEPDHSGDIEITPEVLAVVLGIAAQQVDGVYAMRGSLANNISSLLGKDSHGQGVKLTTRDDGKLSADIYVYLDYGVSVPKVALALQKSLREQMLFMTDLQLAEVNVHVDGLVPEKAAKKQDPADLFRDTDEDTEAPAEPEAQHD
ncbi:Asp23/Gls24 family envelope stress response protein [Schleiferilactobacillus shenzhenensis]|uniref:YqhY n=1 Tax=Schleiferilactobacillus shenzhenensis LY-73 TaxID=1231336 RepID=U4TMW5_9LACO|nr:Asp23/Gls24 family envelope stress response protein [Schleiferilactobacillus shenzhenensis]ERL65559.1 YqhY [Schleiferilactobacillus shenzhenensis LY-73]